jgi:hypothetical protein
MALSNLTDDSVTNLTGRLPEPALLLRFGLERLVILDLPQGLHAGARLRRLHVLTHHVHSYKNINI